MRPKRESRIDSEPDTATIALVDAALSRTSHREFFTRDEAVQLFRDIQMSVHDAVCGAKVASAVNDAVVTFQQDQLLDADRVTDALLDIRLAVTHRVARDDDSEFEAALAYATRAEYE